MEVRPSDLHHIREARLSNESSLHLAVGAPASVRQLRHERAALETEAVVLGLLRTCGLPVAQVIRYESTRYTLGVPFLLTTILPGSQLSTLLVSRNAPAGDRRAAIESQVRSMMTAVSSHTAISFGPIPTVASGKGFGSWSDAFRSMLGDAIKDAEDAFVHLPYAEIWEAIQRNQVALDDVAEARLVVPGLNRPGNFRVEPTQDGHYRISGIIGFQSAFWGDPEMGSVIEGPPPGPASETNRLGPHVFAQGQHRQKILLYTLYRTVLDVVTACYRPDGTGEQELRARRELTFCLAKLLE